MPNRLIVVSVDSLFDSDMPFLRKLPNFGKLLQKASYTDGGMRSVYPAFTYPAHATIITGCYPEKHGIFHNEIFDIGNPHPAWRWWHKDLKVETVIDVAHRAGLTTSIVGWPTMGGCPNCDYLVSKIWHAGEPQSDPLELLRRGCSQNVFEEIVPRHYHKLRTAQPFIDEAMVGCACDIIRKYTPDVMFIHLAHLDHIRHVTGLHGPMVEQAIIAHDDWLGRIMEATMDAGTYETTNFAVLGDHGHLAVKQMFNPNILLAEAGLIELDEAGKIKSWKAYCKSVGMSCQVLMKDPNDAETREKLETLLYSMREEEKYGVESVFTKEEAQREWHLTGSFEYVLESRGDTSFGPRVSGKILLTPDNSDYKFSVATHGHLPYKGAQPAFMLVGPDVKENTVIPRQRLIDEAPTFAKILGLTLPEAQGRVLEELLK